MKAYAHTHVGAPTRPIDTGAATPRPLEHIAAGTASRLGAIAGGLVWLFGGLAAFAFDLFGINLWLTVFEARWVATGGWDSLPAFMGQFGGLVMGVVGASLLGGLLGALTAWIYNITTAPAEEYDV